MRISYWSSDVCSSDLFKIWWIQINEGPKIIVCRVFFQQIGGITHRDFYSARSRPDLTYPVCKLRAIEASIDLPVAGLSPPANYAPIQNTGSICTVQIKC